MYSQQNRPTRVDLASASPAHGDARSPRAPAEGTLQSMLQTPSGYCTDHLAGSTYPRPVSSRYRATPRQSCDNPPDAATATADQHQQRGTPRHARDTAKQSQPGKTPRPWPHSQDSLLLPVTPGPQPYATSQVWPDQIPLCPVK